MTKIKKFAKVYNDVHCVCGHNATYHDPNSLRCEMASDISFSEDSYNYSYEVCSCIKYKQDNLDLVEKLAKKKKLI